jgi:hypothetical protein
MIKVILPPEKVRVEIADLIEINGVKYGFSPKSAEFINTWIITLENAVDKEALWKNMVLNEFYLVKLFVMDRTPSDKVYFQLTEENVAAGTILRAIGFQTIPNYNVK